MIILVDLDDVLNNLCEAWVEYLNKAYNLTVHISDVKEWDFTKAFPSLTSSQVFSPLYDKSLYDMVSVDKDAVKYLAALSQKHTVIVVTNTPYEIAEYKFNKLLYNNFPFIQRENIILTRRKQLIKGDVLIDDYIENLRGGEYMKILFTQHHNVADNLPEDIIRVNNWKELYKLLGEIDEQNYCLHNRLSKMQTAREEING